MASSLDPPHWVVDLWLRIQQRDHWIQQDFHDQVLQSELRMLQQLQHSEQQIQQQQQQIEQEVKQTETLRQQLARLQEHQHKTDAILHNTRAAAHNARVFRDAAIHGGAHQLRRFVKMAPGRGDLLPGAPAPYSDIPRLSVGEVVPHRFFPANYAALRRWSHRRISELSVLLNDDFGIDGTDNLEERRIKLQRFLADGME
ncbi:hypothetical protein PR003_g29927 [Phytophthora rubi]|uniref:Uncharacterized protein n=2 Tax=Phytophthora TaxID=4783 RepID=A0A6A4BDX3_9STRA|nr:hypothetical protein PR002_g28772 [Phytophthora rubi]KAE8965309.1 hypothetical protein PR001_g28773 [Phytophthora rubi]KAE9255374.1 hypothetical protein PF004_g585 [Phytophthora fragariae]KAE9273378.1 hypothetical protein PR003_g29927 [Phytophthora rubi]